MLCFMDRAFCNSDCVNRACPRNLTPELQERALERRLPIAWADYRTSCMEYRSPSGAVTPAAPQSASDQVP